MNHGLRFGSVVLVLLATKSLSGEDPSTRGGQGDGSYSHSRCGPGTLFQWTGQPTAQGGPNLRSPLVTDRPDFTEASSTVGLGVSQFEFGYTFVSDSDGTATTHDHSWGELLLRYGVVQDWLELRLGLLPLTQTETSAGLTQTTTGLEDMYVGLKIGLTPQAGYRPEMALIPQALVPTGSSTFTRGEVLPGLNWVYSWGLSDAISLAGSTQFNRRIADDGESYTRWAQSCSMGYSLTDRWGSYTEWFARLPHSSSDVKPEHYFNGGFTYRWTNDIQWDIRAGCGLNDAAADFFCGSGVSWRFR